MRDRQPPLEQLSRLPHGTHLRCCSEGNVPGDWRAVKAPINCGCLPLLASAAGGSGTCPFASRGALFGCCAVSFNAAHPCPITALWQSTSQLDTAQAAAGVGKLGTSEASSAQAAPLECSQRTRPLCRRRCVVWLLQGTSPVPPPDRVATGSFVAAASGAARTRHRAGSSGGTNCEIKVCIFLPTQAGTDNTAAHPAIWVHAHTLHPTHRPPRLPYGAHCLVRRARSGRGRSSPRARPRQGAHRSYLRLTARKSQRGLADRHRQTSSHK